MYAYIDGVYATDCCITCSNDIAKKKQFNESDYIL